MKRGCLAVLVCGAWSVAEAVCLNPFGCSPSTLEECRAEATKLPTERGVSVALSDCHSKFVTKPAEAKRIEQEKRLASGWKTVSGSSSAISFSKVKTLMGGEPSAEGGNHACLDGKGNPTSDLCTWYEWESAKEKPLCNSTIAWVISHGAFVYRAEFNEKTGQLHRWREAPISTCDLLIQQEP